MSDKINQSTADQMINDTFGNEFGEQEEYSEKEVIPNQKKSNKLKYIIQAAFVVVGVASVAYMFLQDDYSQEKESSPVLSGVSIEVPSVTSQMHVPDKVLLNNDSEEEDGILIEEIKSVVKEEKYNPISEELMLAINKIKDVERLSYDLQIKVESLNEAYGLVENEFNKKSLQLNEKISELDAIDLKTIDKIALLEKIKEDVKKVHELNQERVKKEKQLANRKVPSRVQVKKEVATSSEVLIDKKENKKESVKPANKIEVHSVYSNRVWIKNNDGTLSTFTVGERLPNGEVIKSVNSNGIITNSGKKY